jgi:hypothetical protein
MDQCSICKAFCYFSRLQCDNHHNLIGCLRHSPNDLCKCSDASKKLIIHVEIPEFDMLIAKMDDILEKGINWREKLAAVCPLSENTTLKEYTKVAKRIRYTDPSGERDLFNFISECRDWEEEAAEVCKQNKRKSRTDSVGSFKLHKLSKITYLINKGKKLPFSCPERIILEKKVEDYYAIDESAKALLNLGDRAQEPAIRSVLERASILGIEVESVKELERRSINDSWFQKYGHLENFNHFSLAELQLIEEKILKSSPTHPLILKVRKDLERGEQWLRKATSVLEYMGKGPEEIQHLIEESKSVPRSEQIVNRLQKIVDDWESVRPDLFRLLERKSEPKMSLEELSLLPPDDEILIEKFYESSKHFGDAFEGLAEFCESYMEASRWKKQMVKNFNVRSSLEIELSDWLFDMERIIQNCIDKRVFSCFCFDEPTDKMLVCVICKEAYHIDCVKVIPKHQYDLFQCPCCSVTTNYSHFTKPLLADILFETLAAPKIIRLPEVSRLASMLMNLMNWLREIEIRIESGNATESYLRETLKRMYSLCISCKETAKVESMLQEKFFFAKLIKCSCNDSNTLTLNCKTCEKANIFTCALMHSPTQRAFLCEGCGDVNVISVIAIKPLENIFKKQNSVSTSETFTKDSSTNKRKLSINHYEQDSNTSSKEILNSKNDETISSLSSRIPAKFEHSLNTIIGTATKVKETNHVGSKQAKSYATQHTSAVVTSPKPTVVDLLNRPPAVERMRDDYAMYYNYHQYYYAGYPPPNYSPSPSERYNACKEPHSDRTERTEESRSEYQRHAIGPAFASYHHYRPMHYQLPSIDPPSSTSESAGYEQRQSVTAREGHYPPHYYPQPLVHYHPHGAYMNYPSRPWGQPLPYPNPPEKRK